MTKFLQLEQTFDDRLPSVRVSEQVQFVETFSPSIEFVNDRWVRKVADLPPIDVPHLATTGEIREIAADLKRGQLAPTKPVVKRGGRGVKGVVQE